MNNNSKKQTLNEETVKNILSKILRVEIDGVEIYNINKGGDTNEQ